MKSQDRGGTWKNREDLSFALVIMGNKIEPNTHMDSF